MGLIVRGVCLAIFLLQEIASMHAPCRINWHAIRNDLCTRPLNQLNKARDIRSNFVRDVNVKCYGKQIFCSVDTFNEYDSNCPIFLLDASCMVFCLQQEEVRAKTLEVFVESTKQALIAKIDAHGDQPVCYLSLFSRDLFVDLVILTRVFAERPQAKLICGFFDNEYTVSTHYPMRPSERILAGYLCEDDVPDGYVPAQQDKPLGKEYDVCVQQLSRALKMMFSEARLAYFYGTCDQVTEMLQTFKIRSPDVVFMMYATYLCQEFEASYRSVMHDFLNKYPSVIYLEGSLANGVPVLHQEKRLGALVMRESVGIIDPPPLLIAAPRKEEQSKFSVSHCNKRPSHSDAVVKRVTSSTQDSLVSNRLPRTVPHALSGLPSSQQETSSKPTISKAALEAWDKIDYRDAF